MMFLDVCFSSFNAYDDQFLFCFLGLNTFLLEFFLFLFLFFCLIILLFNLSFMFGTP